MPKTHRRGSTTPVSGEAPMRAVDVCENRVSLVPALIAKKCHSRDGTLRYNVPG